MKMRRLLLGIAAGILMSVPLLPAPAFAAEPSALLIAAAGYTAEKSVTTTQILSTAIKAEHATASASTSRLCGCLSGESAALAIVRPNNDGFVARDPGDESDGDGEEGRMPRAVAVIPGDNDASGDGDHELPQAA